MKHKIINNLTIIIACIITSLCTLIINNSCTSAHASNNEVTEYAGNVYPGYVYVNGVRYTYITNGTYFQIIGN